MSTFAVPDGSAELTLLIRDSKRTAALWDQKKIARLRGKPFSADQNQAPHSPLLHSFQQNHFL